LRGISREGPGSSKGFAGGVGIKDTVIVTARIDKAARENNKIKTEVVPCPREGRSAEGKTALYQDKPAPVKMSVGRTGKDGKPDKSGDTADKKAPNPRSIRHSLNRL
jgi:hypothetical protein